MDIGTFHKCENEKNMARADDANRLACTEAVDRWLGQGAVMELD